MDPRRTTLDVDTGTLKIMEAALAGLYAILITASASSASAGATGLPAVDGTSATIDCSTGATAKLYVSQPNTAVSVKCATSGTLEPEKKNGNDVFLDAQCTRAGVLSSVCPGAIVTAASGMESRDGAAVKANVLFPQLPASQQVVCLKCKQNTGCTAVITVAAAQPQGPQVCAVPGTSVTLQINEPGGWAQFACGTGLSLMPSGATQVYAENCTKEETLKDMTRSPGPENYITLKVAKLKKKKMCYLCKGTAGAAKTGGEDEPCTIYVEVSGSTRLYSRGRLGVVLLCVAAMLRFP